MQLTVVKRIVLGFTISVLFSLAIFFVGFSGIKSINKDLQQINSEAIPMIDLAGSLKAGVLETMLILEEYFVAPFGKLSSYKEKYETVKVIDQDNTAQLELVLDDSLVDSLEEIKAGMAQMYVDGEAMMVLRKEALGIQSELDDERDVFTDIGDEIIGYIYDLESSSSVEGSISAYRFIEKSANDVDNISTSVSEALDGKSTAVIFGANKQISKRLEALDNNISAVESSLGGEDSFKAMKSSLVEYKEYSVKLLGMRKSVLEKLKEAENKLKAAESTEAATKDLLDDLVWGVKDIVDIVQADAKDHVDAANKQLLTFSALGVLVSIGFAAYVVLSIRRPLNRMLEKIEVVANGDLTQDFSSNSQDEFGQLANSMQSLTAKLRSMMLDITSTSDDLGQVAHTTATLSEESSKGANSQKEQTDMVVVALEEMSATVDEVARNINSTLSEVEHAYEVVQEGDTIVGKNIENITDLAKNINESADVIQQLNEDTNNIGGVLDVIRGIAEQTNLLALNAAIEAARAGEQGRGFAVVADEVRTLASRTHDSTAEIQVMIEKLQERAQSAVEKMNLSQEEATESADNIQQAGNALNNISESITQIKDMSQQIAVASEEQAAVTKEQVASMTTISELSDQSADGAQKGLDSSNKMVDMSSNLHKLIHQFKV